MTSVIASIVAFDERFPKLPKDPERRKALEKYFAIGGVIKAHDPVSKKEWPKLTYPDSSVLNKKLKELKEKRHLFGDKHSSWKKSHRAASLYHQVHQFKKLKEPLYWRHLAKKTFDADYRKDSDSVKLPAHLVADKKWQPMVKMFVNDIEYRKQLAETVSTSIVYKKNKKVASYADELQGFRMSASKKQMTDLDKKILGIEEIETSLREMLKWVKE